MVWMYKYDKKKHDVDIIEQLEHRYKYDDQEPRVFYKGEEKSVIDFFQDIFGGNDVFAELRKGFPMVKLHTELNEILQEGKKKIRLRWDQQYCYDQVKKRIDENKKGLVRISGSAGSGKSIVATRLLSHCIKEGKKGLFRGDSG